MPGPPFCATAGTELRPIEPSDHQFLADGWNRRDVRLWVNRHEPMTESDVSEILAGDEAVLFLVCSDGDPVGAAWLFDLEVVHGRGEIGYWITEDHRQEGHATAAAQLLVEYGIAEHRLRKLFARVFEGNDVSGRVLEAAGFREEGHLRDHYHVDGEWLDATLYGYVDDR